MIYKLLGSCTLTCRKWQLSRQDTVLLTTVEHRCVVYSNPLALIVAGMLGDQTGPPIDTTFSDQSSFTALDRRKSTTLRGSAGSSRLGGLDWTPKKNLLGFGLIRQPFQLGSLSLLQQPQQQAGPPSPIPPVESFRLAHQGVLVHIPPMHCNQNRPTITAYHR